MMMAFWIIDALKAKKIKYIKRVEQMAFCSFIGIEATSKKGQYILLASLNLLKATVLQKKKKKCEKERKKCRN
jgi:hypothetical protein